jgi:EAL domain-containing protein (putative c-di-GMP-specific phosphodiesterase class I)
LRRRAFGFEVLALGSSLSGLIEPDRFIGVAEEHGLIGRLSEQVILFDSGAARDQIVGQHLPNPTDG